MVKCSINLAYIVKERKNPTKINKKQIKFKIKICVAV